MYFYNNSEELWWISIFYDNSNNILKDLKQNSSESLIIDVTRDFSIYHPSSVDNLFPETLQRNHLEKKTYYKRQDDYYHRDNSKRNPQRKVLLLFLFCEKNIIIK